MSPHLNPMEILWQKLKIKIEQRAPKKHLGIEMCEEWRNIITESNSINSKSQHKL